MSQILGTTTERPRQTTDTPTGEKPRPPAEHTQTVDLQPSQTTDPPRTQFATSY